MKLLRRVEAEFGSSPISLEEFSQVVGVDSSVLRGRRERASDFPAPIRETESRASYFFRDLLVWIIAAKIKPSVESAVLNQWTLRTAIDRCSSEHGVDATQRLVAGIALLLCHGWSPTQIEGDGASLLLAAARDHVSTLEPEFPVVAVPVDRFQPDPNPATDRDFLRTLISWSSDENENGTAAIDTGSPAASLLLLEMLSFHKNASSKGRSTFISFVESEISSIAKDTTTRISTTAEGLNRLMLTMASLKPGDVIVDPACGQGAIFIAANELISGSTRKTQQLGFVGRELDANVWTLAKIRLGMRKIAHDLGHPGDNGLECELPSHGFAKFISEPGLGIRGLRPWLTRATDLIAEGGIGVVAVPASLVFPPAIDGTRSRGRGAWWGELQPQIDAVVFTPTDQALITLRTASDRPKLLVQIHRMNSAPTLRRHQQEHPGADVPLDVHDPAIAPFMPAQLRRTAELVTAPRKPDQKIDVTTDEFVDCRTIAEITLEALGTPRWADSAPVRAVAFTPQTSDTDSDSDARDDEDSIAAAGGASDGDEHAVSSPPEVMHRGRGNETPDTSYTPAREAIRGRMIRGDVSRRFQKPRAALDEQDLVAQENALIAEATDAIAFLRWLTDRQAFFEDPKRNDPELAGVLEHLTTEEMRRALRRLQLRLEGRETRGRKPLPTTESD